MCWSTSTPRSSLGCRLRLVGTRTYPIAGGAPPFTGSENWTAAPGAAGGGGGDARFPFLAELPDADTAWDLEARNMDDPDLAANGWTVSRHINPWQTLVRVGDVDLSVVPGVNEYRSTLVAGCLLVQLNTATSIMQIAKALPNDNPVCIKSHLYHSHFEVASSHYSWLSNTLQGQADAASRMYIGGVNGQAYQETFFSGVAGITVYVNTGIPSAPQADTVEYSESLVSGNSRGRGVVATHGQIVRPTVERATGFVPLYGGAWVSVGASNGLVYIDYIRRTEVGQFP